MKQIYTVYLYVFKKIFACLQFTFMVTYWMFMCIYSVLEVLID